MRSTPYRTASVVRGVALRVYRNLVRNPDRARNLEVEMLGLGRTLQTPLPPE